MTEVPVHSDDSYKTLFNRIGNDLISMAHRENRCQSRNRLQKVPCLLPLGHEGIHCSALIMEWDDENAADMGFDGVSS